MAVWMVRAGRSGEREDLALSAGLVVIGWDELPDLSGVRSREDVEHLMREHHPDAKPKTLVKLVRPGVELRGAASRRTIWSCCLSRREVPLPWVAPRAATSSGPRIHRVLVTCDPSSGFEMTFPAPRSTRTCCIRWGRS